jgi:hypothetical protein
LEDILVCDVEVAGRNSGDLTTAATSFGDASSSSEAHEDWGVEFAGLVVALLLTL